MWAGASNIAGGVIIGLGALNGIELSTDKSTVSVGAGTTWNAVYTKLDHHGLSVNGGRAACVGVGSLTLGGDVSYFSPRYSRACDSVSSLQIVLSDISIIDAIAKLHADLFFAL
ncbi:hypothetical protein HD806DRAFT_533222 [Xylariaceae sp. AK1471]|nr:hypothetical protein HD806DRAFT_533222 [Xylariaceae sp. AK1471]